MTHTITLELRRGSRKAAKGSTHLSCTGSMRRSLILGRDRHLTFRIQRAGDGGTTGLVRTHWDPAELLRQITSSIDRNTSHRRSLWCSTSSSSALALLLYFCSETDVGGSYKTFKSRRQLVFFLFFLLRMSTALQRRRNIPASSSIKYETRWILKNIFVAWKTREASDRLHPPKTQLLSLEFFFHPQNINH